MLTDIVENKHFFSLKWRYETVHVGILTILNDSRSKTAFHLSTWKLLRTGNKYYLELPLSAGRVISFDALAFLKGDMKWRISPTRPSEIKLTLPVCCILGLGTTQNIYREQTQGIKCLI
jgi:hypothetical protein